MTPTQRKVMEQALEALVLNCGGNTEGKAVAAIAALRAALSEQSVEQAQVALHQFHKRGCADWYDGLPDHEDGGGPYETRTLYTAPQPTIPPGYELADDERVAALCDLSYAAGMKAGWNFCVNDDDAGFERSQSVTGEAMRVLKKHRTMLAASPVKPAEPSLIKLLRYEPEIWREDRIRMELDELGDWVKYEDVLRLIVATQGITGENE